MFSSFSSSRTFSRLGLFEKIEQVLGVQADRQRLAVVARRRASRCPRRAPGSRTRSVRRSFSKESLTPRDRSEEKSATRRIAALAGDVGDDRDLVVALRQDLLVVGKVDVEQARDQLAAADGEEQVILGVADLDRSRPRPSVHLEDLRERLLRNRGRSGRSPCEPSLGKSIKRQPVAVGRHELELLALVLEQGSHELESRLLGRNGV